MQSWYLAAGPFFSNNQMATVMTVVYPIQFHSPLGRNVAESMRVCVN
jgi:hypothetical protein